MLGVIKQASISEVVLLFNLLFVLPTLALLLRRLRKYEALFGTLPDEKRKRKKTKVEPTQPPAKEEKKPSAGKYPYKVGVFLSPPERSCLTALEQALGNEVAVFPKAALSCWIEPTEKDPAYSERLDGLELDYIVCDRRTGQALTAILFNAVKGRPAGRLDEIRKICEAAGAKLAFIEFVEGVEYDPVKLKKDLGISDFDL